MDNQKNITITTEAPSELELARLEFNDELALALDNACGVAYTLDMMADEQEPTEVAMALHMLAATLRDGSQKVYAARRTVDALATGKAVM